MSLGARTDEVNAAVARSMAGLGEAFAKIAREAGHSTAEAKRRGQDVVMRLQGALVMCRASGDNGAFRRVLKELPDSLGEQE